MPAAILAATAYTQTRLAMIVPDDDGHGHGPGAWGIFALTDGAGDAHDLARGAALASVTRSWPAPTPAPTPPPPPPCSSRPPAATARARCRAGATRSPGSPAVATPAAASPPTCSATSPRGVSGRDDLGRRVIVSARPEAARGDGGLGSVTQGLGYPGAIWNPASTANYAAGNRGAAQINYVVVHTTQGSYNGTISWFKNPDAKVSSHYVIRSTDGEITQMVDDSDVAWHDACFNSQSIGIEHEGFVADPDRWYTRAMYIASATLTAWLADKYGIPKDRQHIYGHGDAPDCPITPIRARAGTGTTTSIWCAPAARRSFGAAAGAAETPTQMISGEEAVVWFEFRNDSNITWSITDTRLGTQEPMDRESAFFVDGNWLRQTRATAADHSNYGPGATARFTFAIRAPEVTEATTYRRGLPAGAGGRRLVRSGGGDGHHGGAARRWTYGCRPDLIRPTPRTRPIPPTVTPAAVAPAGGNGAGGATLGRLCDPARSVSWVARRRRRCR